MNTNSDTMKPKGLSSHAEQGNIYLGVPHGSTGGYSPFCQIINIISGVTNILLGILGT